MPGKFIVIEGIDGCGSSTVIRGLGEFLEQKGHRVQLTSEPTDGPAGAVIRMALRKRLELDPMAVALLFAADRLDHLHNPHDGILAYLENGYHVLSDRYKLSSLAYQSTEPGIDLDWVVSINSRAREPDLTVLMDLPAELALERKRVQQPPWGMELYEYREKQERVRQRYLDVASDLKGNGDEVAVVDASGSKAEVLQEVLVLVQSVVGIELQ